MYKLHQMQAIFFLNILDFYLLRECVGKNFA